MPRAKKASIKTKAVDMKSKKRNVKQPKKTRDEGAELQQTFTNSLSQLSAYWKKRVAATKKQIETTRSGLKKAQDKLKTTKVSPTAKKAMQTREKLQVAIIEAKETLALAKQEQSVAKLEAKKYVQLSKAISTIEKDCRKQLAELAAIAKEEAKKEKAKAKAKAKSAKAKKAEKTEPKKTAAKAKTKKAEPKKTAAKAKAPKATPTTTEAPKKRGRKPKIRLVETVDIAETLPENNVEQVPSDIDAIPDFVGMIEQEESASLVVETAAEAIDEDNDEMIDY